VTKPEMNSGTGIGNKLQIGVAMVEPERTFSMMDIGQLLWLKICGG